LSQIEISGDTSWTAAQPRSGDGLTRLNTITFWILLAVLALAPLPFGSARALYWAAAAVTVGGVATCYFIAVGVLGLVPRIALGRFLPQTIMFVVVCAWLVVQMLPVLPTPLLLPDGMTIEVSTISIAPGMTMLMLIRQLTYGLFFYLMLQASARDQRRRVLLDVLLWVIVAYGVYGMTSLYSGDTILGLEKWAYYGYATGTFVNRNSFATFLAMGGVIAAARVGKLLSDRAEKHPGDGGLPNFRGNLLVYGLAYAFLLTVVLSTGSRMGLFVTVAGAVTAFAVVLRRTRLGLVAIAVPAGLAVAVSAMAYYGQALLERLGSLESSANVRGNFYVQVWELIMQRPWTGFGGGAFELAFPLVHAAPVNSDLVWSKGHNTYLTLWSELGFVVGSLPIIAVALVAVRIGIGIVRKRGSIESQAIGAGVLTVGAIHSLVDFSLEIPANTFVFLALLAAGAVSTVNLRSSST
jgi:O-antigen ligase